MVTAAAIPAKTEFTGAALKVMPAAGDASANLARFELFARQAADRVVFMDHGEILEQGAPAALLDAPEHPRIREFVASIER